MTDTTSAPPEVAAAAAKVQAWLREQSASPDSADARAKMSPAARIEYCRGFDQSQMPPWKDPR